VQNDFGETNLDDQDSVCSVSNNVDVALTVLETISNDGVGYTNGEPSSAKLQDAGNVKGILAALESLSS
jgi:hypothetical protein